MKSGLLICVVLLLGCNISRLAMHNRTTTVVTWDEQPDRNVANIMFGVPAISKTLINYRRKGKTALQVTLSEPDVIVAADKPQTWGYYQFPTIERLKDGSLHADWSLHADAIESYGLNAVGSAISKDGA